MDEDAPARLDIFKAKNIAKILICLGVTGFIIYEMLIGFLYSDIYYAGNEIRYEEVKNEVQLINIGMKHADNGVIIFGECINISRYEYMAIVADVDLIDINGRIIERVRAGKANVKPGEKFEFAELFEYQDVSDYKFIRLDGIVKKK